MSKSLMLGGPRDGHLVDLAGWPSLSILFPRIPDDGPAVMDVYEHTGRGETFGYVGERAWPSLAPVAEPPEGTNP